MREKNERQIACYFNNFAKLFNAIRPEGVVITQESFRIYFENEMAKSFHLDAGTISEYLTSKPWPKKYGYKEMQPVVERVIRAICADNGWKKMQYHAITASKYVLLMAFKMYDDVGKILTISDDVYEGAETIENAALTLIYDTIDQLDYAAAYRICTYGEALVDLTDIDIQTMNMLLKISDEKKNRLMDDLKKKEIACSYDRVMKIMNNPFFHQWIALRDVSHNWAIVKKKHNNKAKVTEKEKENLRKIFKKYFDIDRNLLVCIELSDLAIRIVRFGNVLLKENFGELLGKDDINLFIFMKYWLSEQQRKEVLKEYAAN